MFWKGPFFKIVAFALSVWLPGVLASETLSVPSGTRVFIELDQRVTSKKKHNAPGSFVDAHVWRDVVVDGHTVIRAGTPAMVQIGHIKGAKVAGVKGQVELKALQVSSVAGNDVMLVGGYDKSGKNLTALSVSLAVLVFVPLIFLKGKQAKLEPGTIFDAMVANETHIEIDSSVRPRLKLSQSKPLIVTVRYEELETNAQGEKEVKDLPLKIVVEGDTIEEAQVVKVNDELIVPIPISVGAASDEEDGYVTAEATVDLKALGKFFTKGFNTFVVAVNGHSQEVMLDVEL